MVINKDIFRLIVCIISQISITEESQNLQILSGLVTIFTALSVSILMLCGVSPYSPHEWFGIWHFHHLVWLNPTTLDTRISQDVEVSDACQEEMEIIFGLPSSCSSYHTEGHNTVRNVYLIILNSIFSNTIISTSSQEEKEGIYFWAHQNAYEWEVRGVQGFIHHHSRWFFITIIVLIQVSSS